MILHILNLSGANGFPDYLEENFPVGPLYIAVKTENLAVKKATLRVSETQVPADVHDGWTSLVLDKITDHEMILLEA